jgi:hypothetical protein
MRSYTESQTEKVLEALKQDAEWKVTGDMTFEPIALATAIVYLEKNYGRVQGKMGFVRFCVRAILELTRAYRKEFALADAIKILDERGLIESTRRPMLERLQRDEL